MAASGPLQRTVGEARIRFKRGTGGTELDRVFQRGASKVRFPAIAAGEPFQAVLMNNAGGLTGGDRLSTEIDVGAGCRAVIVTPACERIYRSSSGAAEVAIAMRVAEDARLDWLPQETILFDGGRLRRSFEVDLACAATFLAVEAVVLGRTARGETISSGEFRDRWRIRRGGRLIYADDLRFDWRRHDPSRPAALAGAAAAATLILCGPDLGDLLDPLRRVIGETGGASSWDGKLIARVRARDGAALRQIVTPALAVCLGGPALPRFWGM